MAAHLSSDADGIYALRYVLEPDGFDKTDLGQLRPIPVLCSYCDMPLAVSMQDLTSLVELGSTTASQRGCGPAVLHYAAGVPQTHNLQLMRSVHTACDKTVEELKAMLTPEHVAQITPSETTFEDLVATVNAVHHDIKGNEDVGLARLAANLDTYRELSDAAAQGLASVTSVVYGTIKFLIHAPSSYPHSLSLIVDALSDLALDIRGFGLFDESMSSEPLKHAQCAATEIYLELFHVLKAMVGELVVQALQGESISDQYWNPFRAAAERPLDRIRFLYYQGQETSAERTALAITKGQVQIDEKARILYVKPESLPALANQYLSQLLPHLARTAFWAEEEHRLRWNLPYWKQEIYGSYLNMAPYRDWIERPQSSMLGVLGGPATGKAIVLALLRVRTRELARGASAICWLDFKHRMDSWLANVQLVIWQIFFQRPGMLFQKLQLQQDFINDVGRNTLDADVMWRVLIQLTRELDELWLFAEGLQDGDATCGAFVRHFRELMEVEAPGTRIKCCMSSTKAEHLATMEHHIELRPQNIEQGMASWLRRELATLGIVDEESNKTMAATINKIGGGYIWARLLVAIVENTSGMTPTQAVAGIESQEDAVIRMWTTIRKAHDEDQMRLLRPLALVIAKRADFMSPEAARDAVIKVWPDLSTAFTLDDVRDLLKNHLPGLVTGVFGGDFSMQPDFAIHLLGEMRREDAERRRLTEADRKQEAGERKLR